MGDKKKSLFDNIRVPLEDLTEEESKALDNDPEFQKRMEESIKRLGKWQEEYRKKNQDKRITLPSNEGNFTFDSIERGFFNLKSESACSKKR